MIEHIGAFEIAVAVWMVVFIILLGTGLFVVLNSYGHHDPGSRREHRRGARIAILAVVWPLVVPVVLVRIAAYLWQAADLTSSR